MNRREVDRKAMPLLLAGLVVALTLLTLYLAGYLFLGWVWTPGPRPGARIRMRVFRHESVAVFYRPVGWLESQLRGYPVTIGTEKDLILSSP